MTRNTLEYLKLLETIRNNKVIAQLRGAELAELIANNKRVFKINLSKNAIEKLRNDQLDSRERDKINHDVDIRLQELAEKIRSDQANEANSRFSSILRAYAQNPVNASLGMLVAAGDEYLRNPENGKKEKNEIPATVTISGKTVDYNNQDPLGPGMSLAQYDKYIGKNVNPGLRQRISDGYVIGFTGTEPETGNKGGKHEITTSKTVNAAQSRYTGGKERDPGANLSQSNNSSEGGKASVVYSKEVKERRSSGPSVGAAFM